MNRFSVLQLRQCDSYKRWVLVAPFHYRGEIRDWTVPEGFETDLDSVPRIPLVYALFKGRTVRAAVLHDYLYESQQGKRLADEVFLEAMKAEGLSFRHRWIIYLAVALFGWPTYSRKRT